MTTLQNLFQSFLQSFWEILQAFLKPFCHAILYLGAQFAKWALCNNLSSQHPVVIESHEQICITFKAARGIWRLKCFWEECIIIVICSPTLFQLNFVLRSPRSNLRENRDWLTPLLPPFQVRNIHRSNWKFPPFDNVIVPVFHTRCPNLNRHSCVTKR